MKHYFIGFLFTLLMLGCNKRSQGPASLTHFVPDNTETILRINDLESFRADLKNSDIISKISYLEDLENNIPFLSKLKTNETILILLSPKGENHALVTKYSDSLFGGVPLDSIKIEHKIIDSVFIASSNNSFDVTQLKRSVDVEFDKVYNSSERNKSFSLYYKGDSTRDVSKAFLNNEDQPFADWVSIDVEILSEDAIRINGVATLIDTIQKGISLFKNSIPQENTLISFSPSNIDYLKTMSYDDYLNFGENLMRFSQQVIDSINTNPLLETFNEVGVISINNQKAILAKSIDGNSTGDLLIPFRNESERFREVTIYKLDHNFNFEEKLNPILDTNAVDKYIEIDDYFAFSSSTELLKTIISSYSNRNTLDKNFNYRHNADYLSSESSQLEVVGSNNLAQKLRYIFKDSLVDSNFSKYEKSAFQIIQDDGFAHINVIIQKGSSRIASTGINELFNTQLDADLITSPQFVINHRTNQKEVVVQDLNNTLYLISNRGKVLWKKQVHGKILGEIEQVDLYKNGRLQLAFATSNRVYVLDRNGNDVAPFPLRFQDEITQPLSIFDYDNNRDYRFLVTQGSNLLMYDKRGRTISGFNYRSSNNRVTTQPKHFRISNKDYIVFVSGEDMKILNRRGQSRINVKEQVSYSNNPIFNYRNTFTTTSKLGELIQVNLNGTVSKQNLNLGSDHKVDATSKTLVTSFENQLNIKLKNYELEFGEYTSPQIFYLNDKIYISITDLQSSKVFMFDSQAKLLSHFPIYGNSMIALENIDRDRNLEIVVQGESNSIIVYKMN